jgi:membrane protease YdiL (CAAX protease family)
MKRRNVMEGVRELKIKRVLERQDATSPPQSSLIESLIILAAIAVLSAFMMLPRTFAFWIVLILSLLTVLAIALRFIQAIHLLLFGLSWIALPLIAPLLGFWPQILLLPIIIYALVLALIPNLRRSILWLRAGRLTSRIIILILATIMLSIIALVGWYLLFQPNVTSHLAMIPKMPMWLLPLACLGFAMLNAAMEEVVFRGIMMQALDSVFGAGILTIVIQAFSFASFHYLGGFPNGVWGFAMVFVYGFMLGVLRRRSQGILASWIAHVLADIAIFAILATVLYTSNAV